MFLVIGAGALKCAGKFRWQEQDCIEMGQLYSRCILNLWVHRQRVPTSLIFLFFRVYIKFR